MRSALRDAALRDRGWPWKKAAGKGEGLSRDGQRGWLGTLAGCCRPIPVVQLSDVLKPRKGEAAFRQTATKVLLVIAVWKARPCSQPQPQCNCPKFPLSLVLGSVLGGSRWPRAFPGPVPPGPGTPSPIPPAASLP